MRGQCGRQHKSAHLARQGRGLKLIQRGMQTLKKHLIFAFVACDEYEVGNILMVTLAENKIHAWESSDVH